MKIILLAAAISIFPATANAQSTDRWKTDFSLPGTQIARVTNAGGSTAGVLCNLNTEGCEAYLALDLTCEEEVITPMMVSAKAGAFHITTRCTKVGATKLMVINEFETVVGVFQGGGEIGFAMPLESGQFKVVRFGTNGAVAAIKAARQPPAKPAQRRLKPEENL